MLLGPAPIEYIVAHKLAHLSIKNHTADYWELVVSAIPDGQQRRRWMREAGRGQPVGGP